MRRYPPYHVTESRTRLYDRLASSFSLSWSSFSTATSGRRAMMPVGINKNHSAFFARSYYTSYTSQESSFSLLSSSLSGPPIQKLVPPGQCQFGIDPVPVPLLHRVAISPTSYVLRFALPDSHRPLQLSTCACILAVATIHNNNNTQSKQQQQQVLRAYTPISTNNDIGYFDLLVKSYPHGCMSKHLCETIKIGDCIDFKHNDASVKIQAPFHECKVAAMIAGGTGITPMIQALHAILPDPNGPLVILLYGSRSSQDILAYDLLHQWSIDYSSRFQLIHVISDELSINNQTWNGECGTIDQHMIQKYIPSPTTIGDDLKIFVCGPPLMYEALSGSRKSSILTGTLATMGYTANQVYKF
jgi:cytochrome-b5 reductase